MRDDDPKWIALCKKLQAAAKVKEIKLKALNKLDASKETGALKTIIEFLQR